MSVSTDAELYYGIQFGEDEMPWKEEEWKDYYAKKMGFALPADEYSEENKEEYSMYWRKKAEIAEQSLCKVGVHCSCDYPMRYICIKSSLSIAWRGEPVEIKSLEVQGEWDERLKEFCKLMGVEYSQPKWWLSSLWC